MKNYYDDKKRIKKDAKQGKYAIFNHYFKTSLKPVAIWSAAVASLMFLVIAMYPFFEDTLATLVESSPDMAAFIEVFTGGGISNAADFYILEGGQMYLLVGSIFAAFIGINIFKKEIVDGSYEYIYTQPVTRSKIFISKLLTCIVSVVFFNMFIAITSIAGMYLIIDDISFNMLYFFYYFVISTIIGLIILNIAFAVGGIIKEKAHLGIAAGVVLYLYIASFISDISEKFEILGLFTPFSLINMSSNEGILYKGIKSLDLLNMSVWISLSVFMLFISLKTFNRLDIKN